MNNPDEDYSQLVRQSAQLLERLNNLAGVDEAGFIPPPENFSINREPSEFWTMTRDIYAERVAYWQERLRKLEEGGTP